MLQNKKYIKFADKNTVEVISLGRLDEGIKKGARRAGTYSKKVNGEDVEFLVEFPNLTVDQIYALRRSKAAGFNDTGKIPFTALVDPHTGQEMQRWSGGISGGTIMDAVTEVRKRLRKQHGAGVTRKTIRQLEDAEASSQAELAKGEFAKAIEAVAKLSRLSQEWPQAMAQRVSDAHTRIVGEAQDALDRLEDLSLEDPAGASRALVKLKAKLKGTGLEDRVQRLILDLKQ